MNRHPDNRELLYYLAGFLDRKRARALEAHLRLCAPCTARRDELGKLLEGPGIKVEGPPLLLRDRVLRSCRELADKSQSRKEARRLWPFAAPLWPRLATGLVLFLAAAGALFYLLRVPGGDSLPYAQEILALRGPVSLNGRSAVIGSRLAEGGRLILTGESHMELGRKGYFLLRLRGDSELLMVRSRQTQEGGLAELRYELLRGALYSRFEEGKGRFDYAYRTPLALIRPLGTEFYLLAEKDRTVLMLLRGRVAITGVHVKKEIIAEAGRKYSIAAEIVTEDLTEKDRLWMKRFAAAFESSPGQGKKAVPHREKVAPEDKEEVRSGDEPAKENAVKDEKKPNGETPKDRNDLKKDRKEVKAMKSDMRDMRKKERRGRR